MATLMCAAMLIQPICVNADTAELDVSSEAATSSQAYILKQVPNADGIYIAEDLSADWLSGGNMRKGASHLEDKDGNRLTKDYIYLVPLSGSAGLYGFGEPAGHSDSWGGVLRYKDGEVKILVEAGLDYYHGVDAGEASFYFPSYTQGEYYDKDGNRIADLGTYLKPYGISLERDTWAEKAITDAINRNYMPPTLSYNYRSNITRREYCYLAMAAVEHSITYNKNVTTPFNDVDDYYVSAAADLGIVSGMGNGSFEPDRAITRQEAAVLLCNLAKVIGRDGEVQSVSKFADDGSCADWAKASIYKICGIKSHNGDGVMVGVGNNRFSPKTNYTRQQAVVTIYRLLNDYDD
jgi:hypothetical protein